MVDEGVLEGRVKLTQLYFEDFLEALVRVAALKALPTDAMICRRGCADGGELLLYMMTECPPSVYTAFVQQHTPKLQRGTAALSCLRDLSYR